MTLAIATHPENECSDAIFATQDAIFLNNSNGCWS